MESVGSLEEEVKLNIPVPAPHIIPYSSSCPPLLRKASNPNGEISLVSGNDGIESKKDCAIDTILWDK